jgi:hypothetical protein
LLLSRGWRIDRAENVESAVRDRPATTIVFQNVDQACSLFHSPLAISSKGPAADRMINGAQGQLFAASETPEVVKPDAIARLNSSVWFFCMSFDGDNICAELSLPASMNGNNFAGFIERIFLVSGGDWGGVAEYHEDDAVDVLPVVMRR